jgi:kynureninase
MAHLFTPEYAYSLDEQDPLKTYRNQFYLPYVNNANAIYFLGNSLGLQPRNAQDEVLEIMENWANYGVEGFFMGNNPWLKYQSTVTPLLSTIVGANSNEVVIMNHLTVNLHLLMASFYQPTNTRYKILCEANAFPSDLYALKSQIEMHGKSITDCLIEVHPSNGTTITTADIEAAIQQHGNTIALVFFSGVNYLNGQVFDIEKITQAAHIVGAYAGFDLAHAAGNVNLQLHNWQVDFACWCTYKYLNAGPGAIGAAFVHQNHLVKKIPRLQGWWGNAESNRFKMEPNFTPSNTAEDWQLSTPPIMLLATLKASLQIFKEVGFGNLLQKQKELLSYLDFCMLSLSEKEKFTIITPTQQQQRGCQVSIVVHQNAKAVFEQLLPNGIFADWREPNIIRIAPVPMYNNYSEIFNFALVFNEILKTN